MLSARPSHHSHVNHSQPWTTTTSCFSMTSHPSITSKSMKRESSCNGRTFSLRSLSLDPMRITRSRCAIDIPADSTSHGRISFPTPVSEHPGLASTRIVTTAPSSPQWGLTRPLSMSFSRQGLNPAGIPSLSPAPTNVRQFTHELDRGHWMPQEVSDWSSTGYHRPCVMSAFSKSSLSYHPRSQDTSTSRSRSFSRF